MLGSGYVPRYRNNLYGWLTEFVPRLYRHRGLTPPTFSENGKNLALDFARAIGTHKRLIASTANGVWKTHLMSFVPFWFLTTHGPDARWLTIGQQWQVHLDTLWAEIGRRYHEFGGKDWPGGGWGELLTGELRIDAGRVFAKALSSDDPGSIYSHKAKCLGCHIDEAGRVAIKKPGVISEIERAMPQLLMLTGNPESPADEFGQIIERPADWFTLSCSALDLIEWKEQRGIEIPGTATREYVARMERFRGSALYDSAVLGKLRTDDPAAIVKRGRFREACERAPIATPDGEWHVIVACDVAYAEGGDRRVIGSMVPGCHRVKSVKRGSDTAALMACAEELWAYAQELHTTHGKSVEIRVDVGGPGAGTCGRLKELLAGCSWCSLTEFGFGDANVSDPHYANRGSEAWGDCAKLLDTGNIALITSSDDGFDTRLDLDDELTSRRWKPGAKVLMTESKEDWRKRLKRSGSPDIADELVMACWQGVKVVRPQVVFL